jgi:hypothetical protein
MSSRLQGPISKIGDIGLSPLEVQNPIEQVHKFQSTAEKMKNLLESSSNFQFLIRRWTQNVPQSVLTPLSRTNQIPPLRLINIPNLSHRSHIIKKNLRRRGNQEFHS